MSDLTKYVTERRKRDKAFAKDYEEGYGQFKIGVLLREARESAGMTQEELARRLKTKKTAISRIENHAEDIKLSTLERVAKVLHARVRIALEPEKKSTAMRVAETPTPYRTKRVKANAARSKQAGKRLSRC